MTDILFPTDLRVSRAHRIPLSNSVAEKSIETGKVFTNVRDGDKWRFGIRTDFASDRAADFERSRLEAFAARLRGATNKFWFTPPGYVRRGSFPAPELLANNTFANGTAGWSTAAAVVTVADRVARVTSTMAGEISLYQNITLSQYVPYVLRSFITDGKHSAGYNVGRYLYLGENSIADYSTSARGLGILSGVNNVTGAQGQYPLVMVANAGASSYMDVHYTSLARCCLIDNGPNLLTRSDEINHGDWTPLEATIGANSRVAPDGTVTADTLIETAATSSHNVSHEDVTVSSSAADYSFSVALRGNNRLFALLQLTEGTGGTAVFQYFNLSTGNVGTDNFTGANWSNLRSFAVPLGDGWYQCTIVARKTNGATSITPTIAAYVTDGGGEYPGTVAVDAITIWRATLAQSGVPTRLRQTTAAATTGTAQTGPGIHLKGLPANTSGLLLPGDFVQIGNQLQMVDASLDSDAAGLGYLQTTWPLRAATMDNAAVIVHEPMGRFVMIDPYSGSSDLPGGLADFDFIFEEAA